MDVAPDAPPVTMSRLRAAFARMLGKPSSAAAAPAGVTPEGIVEALLFVGRSDDAPLSAAELAGVIRDVTPEEVEGIVDRLDELYQSSGAPARVERAGDGYRLRLAPEYERLGDRLAGPARATRLPAPAIECLSIIAYRQPIDADAIEALRGERCGAPLRQLVRLGLVQLDPPADGEGAGSYRTSDRFLKLLGLQSLRQLPRIEEIGD